MPKCEKCHRIVNEGGYEYPCYVCAIFGDADVPEPFALEDDYGCKLHPKELDKLVNMVNEMDGLQWYGIEASIHNRPLNEKELAEKKRLEELSKEHTAYMNHLKEKYKDVKR